MKPYPFVMETTSRVLMIRPANFAYNYQTSLTNAFQRLADDKDEDVHEKALLQFNALVQLLCANGIDVTVVDDSRDPHTPDSIFPNNWISFYQDCHGMICLHPMFAINRRLERKQHILQALHQRFVISDTMDFTHYEQADEFLEGTGSMVLDRKNRIAYACLSSRTSLKVFQSFCSLLNYEPVAFRAMDTHGRPIYHTNVMMSVCHAYAIVCLDTIRFENERTRVVDTLLATGKEIVTIDTNQMCRFAGNCLQLQSGFNGDRILFMSTQAYHSLRIEQIEKITKFNKILHSDVDIIEVNGGGSVRCMIAEIFLPVRSESLGL